MRTVNRSDGRLSRLLVSLLCLAMTVSFVHHLRHGKHGLEARAKLVQRSTAQERRISELRAVRSALARDCALLRDGDPDLVAEIAAGLFHTIAPGERVLAIEPTIGIGGSR